MSLHEYRVLGLHPHTYTPTILVEDRFLGKFNGVYGFTPEALNAEWPKSVTGHFTMFKDAEANFRAATRDIDVSSLKTVSEDVAQKYERYTRYSDLGSYGGLQVTSITPNSDGVTFMVMKRDDFLLDEKVGPYNRAMSVYNSLINDGQANDGNTQTIAETFSSASNLATAEVAQAGESYKYIFRFPGKIPAEVDLDGIIAFETVSAEEIQAMKDECIDLMQEFGDSHRIQQLLQKYEAALAPSGSAATLENNKS